MSRETEQAIELFADRLSELVMAKVERALALERDRIEADVAEIRADVANIGRRLELLAAGGLHSVRVDHLQQ